MTARQALKGQLEEKAQRRAQGEEERREYARFEAEMVAIMDKVTCAS